MRNLIPAIAVLLLVSAAHADDTFTVATLDTPGNALNILQFTIPASGPPAVTVRKTVRLPSGPEFLARNAAGDHLYVSAGSAGQIVDVNVSTGTAASTVAIGLPRRLQVTSPACLTYGVSPATGQPALETSPLPTLAPAAVASPATTRFQDLTVLGAGTSAFLASTRDVTGTAYGEVHQLDASACPPRLVKTLSLGANKAAFAISPTGASTALVSLLGGVDLQSVNFATSTMAPAGIANLPPKPRLVRRLEELANRHYVIDQDGRISLLDTGVTPPVILASLVVGPSPSVVVVDPAKKWLVVFDRSQPSDARLFAISGGTVDPATVKVVRLTAPVHDAVMLP